MPFFATTAEQRKFLVMIIISLLIFLLDIVTPLGINESILYLLPILFTISLSKQRYTSIISITALLLTFLGFYLSPEGLPVKTAIITRFYVGIGICVAWFILLKYKEKDNKIKDQNIELLKKELFSRTIFESSPDCLQVMDATGRIEFMNFNGLCQMEIDNFSSVKQKEWWTLWGSENETLVKNAIDKASTGELVKFIAFCPSAKGTPKWWDVLVAPVGKQGEIIEQIVSVSRDITLQKAEEQRLKLLESVITNTKDAILITEAEPFDEPGPKIIYVNEAFTKMTGYTAEEVIGKTPRILQGPNSDKEELARLSHAIRNWESCEISTINYKKNGEEFWINFALTPVANEKGWFTHWISIERDITEQKIKELENELLAQISVNFNAETNYFTAVNGLCEAISKFGKFDIVEVWTSNLEKSKIQLISHYAADLEDEQFYIYSQDFRVLNMSESIAGKVWSEKTQILWDDVKDHEHFVRRDGAKKIGLKSMLGIPLIFNNEVVGVLKIGTKRDTNYLKKYARIFHRLENFIGSELNRKNLENDLSRLFDTIPDILCLADFKGRFLKINKSGCELLGYSEEEILLQTFDSFVHPDDIAFLSQEIKQLERKETTLNFENRFMTKRGEIIWLSWYFNSDLHENLIYATAKNITEEKKLRELNRQVNAIAKIGSWEINLGNKSLFWSEEVHQLHETNPKTFAPNLNNGLNFYREDFQKAVKKYIKKCISNTESFDFEAVLITTTKQEKWVRVIGDGEFVNNKCTRIYGSYQDITSLKDTENRLRSFSENIPGVIFEYVIQPDGTHYVQHLSGMVQELCGYSREKILESIAPLWEEITLGGSLNLVKSSICQSIETKSNWSCRYKIIMPNGELRTHLGTGTPTFLADKTIVLNIIVLDITKDVKNEELLSQITEIARIGSWEMDLINHSNGEMYWSPMLRSILEIDDRFKPTFINGLKFYLGNNSNKVEEAFNNLITEGLEFDEELLLLTAKGNKKWVRCIGKSETVNNNRVKIYGSFQDINEQKNSEIKLAESESRFRTILQAEPECVKLLDPDGKLLMINPAGLAIIEADNEEQVRGKSLLGVILPQYRDAFLELKKKVFNGENGRLIFEIEGFKGTHRWLEIHAVPLKNEQGDIISLLGVTIDITEKKEAEIQLQNANERFEKVTEATNDAIWDWNMVQNTFYRSIAIEKFFGKDTLKSLSESDFWTNHFHPADLTKIKESIAEAISNPLTNRWELEYRIYNEKGEIVYVIDRGLIIRDKLGKAIRMVGAMTDITEQKKSDQEIRFQANLLGTIGQATIATDLDGIVNFWNKAAENIYGWKHDEAIGRNIIDLTPLDTNIEEAKNIMSELEKGQSWSGEFKVRKKDGTTFPVLITNSPTYDENNVLSGMIGISSDITREVKSEELLKQYTLDLERSNEELEQFAFVASHDLQEPLRMISSFMDLLKRKYGDQLDEKGHQYIHFATDGAKRMKQIILDLLEYSRASRPTEGKENVNLNDVLLDFKQLRRKLILEKKASIQYSDLPVFYTYKASITQILHCLLDNALKYSFPNRAPILEISVIEREQEWEFSIKDNGIGIDNHFFEKIFLIFQRLHNKDEYDGTGIGLSVVKRHVEYLGGRIWLTSELEKGSVFYFIIPKKQ